MLLPKPQAMQDGGLLLINKLINSLSFLQTIVPTLLRKCKLLLPDLELIKQVLLRLNSLIQPLGVPVGSC